MAVTAAYYKTPMVKHRSVEPRNSRIRISNIAILTELLMLLLVVQFIK